MSYVLATPQNGKQIPDPDRGDTLPESGRRVEDNQYWRRRETVGDVTLTPVPDVLPPTDDPLASTIRAVVNAVSAISGNQTVTSAFFGTYRTTDNTAATWTLPQTGPLGTSFDLFQGGTGQITFSGSGNANLYFSASNTHTKTARQGAAVSVRCVANADGNHAVWMVAGATA